MIAPAMNTGMWEHPATQANLATLANNHVKQIDWNEVYSVARSKRGTEGSK